MQADVFYPDLRRTERILNREMAVRFGLIGLCIVSGWLVFDLWFLPIWYPIYITAVLLERWLSYRASSLSPRFAFVGMWIVGFLVACAYVCLPIMVWNIGSEMAKFATMILLCGACLNVFLLRSRNLVLGSAYIVPLVMVFFWIGGQQYEAPGGGPAFWLNMVLCVALALYFWLCATETSRTNNELRSTRAQFEQAQKVEVIGAMTSGVAHDFNNLLSVVQGNLELLKHYPDAPDRATFLDDALKATKRGAELTRQLTSYGRAMPSGERHVDPTLILRGVKDMAKRILPANITLKLELPEPGGQLLVNETTLHTALLNLVINARDAISASGTITLSIENPATPPATTGALPMVPRYLAFVVHDTGEGIPKDLLDRVRDPFFSTKPAGQGSGLGLAMVTNFARLAGGEFEIDSTEGQGTTARLYLPKG